MYRETFDNRFSIFRGGLSLTNSMNEVATQWLNLFENHAPLMDKSESRYKGLFFEGCGETHSKTYDKKGLYI